MSQRKEHKLGLGGLGLLTLPGLTPVVLGSLADEIGAPLVRSELPLDCYVYVYADCASDSEADANSAVGSS